VDHIRRGETAAFEVLYDRYSAGILGFCRHMLGNPADAEDATQQTFVQAWRAAGSYDPTRPLGAWLTTIAKRVAIDVHRRERRHRNLDNVDTAESDTLVTLPPSAEQIHDVAAVRRALDELPAPDRQLIRMQHFDELSHAEIADELEIPLGTVKSRTFRAHKRLAGILSHLRTEPAEGGSDGRR
jgi:RNA polymerase sigma-70 factor (ECF subfamily)